MFKRVITRNIAGEVISDSLDSASIEMIQEAKVHKIKALAGKLITKIEGENLWKLRREEQRGNATAIYTEIESIRTKSNEAETAVSALTDKAEAHNFDTNNWPQG